MHRTRLTVRLERHFTEPMEALRRTGWDRHVPGPARDEFDDESRHLVVRHAGLPVGMVRMTMAERSVLATWSRDQAPLSHGRGIAELTRGVVVAPMRRLGLYRLAMLETLLRLRALGAHLATGAVERTFPARLFLEDVGFRAVGRPIVFNDAPRSRTIAQCLLLKIDAQSEARWDEMYRAQVDSLLAAGYLVDSEVSQPAMELGPPA